MNNHNAASATFAQGWTNDNKRNGLIHIERFMTVVLRYIFLTGIAFVMPLFTSLLLAQEKCGTVAYTKSLYENPALRKIEFEKWLLEAMPRHRLPGGARTQAAPYKIPVVVHIIHNGEPIGQGANIPDAQVLSQIKVLNEDFQRLNADATSTPPEFAAVAGSLDVEFVLAKQNPEGQATTGIVRVNGGRTSWTMNDNYTLKSLSYWPAEQYMNIWVANITSHLGYAQFPESDLEGLENSSTNRLTDGVVIWHRAFGSAADGSFDLDSRFDRGRTATHETGHFLGLNHIWGDDAGCNGTDYVADTPNQGDRTEGCPAHPRIDNCGEVIMFQNFMDYVDDDCMNLFTEGQISRVVTVLEESPRRASLLTSPGLEEPDPVPNDLGIREIVFPDANVCSNLITPVIELRNYGSNVVTTGRVRLVIDGITQETVDFPLNLDLYESAQVAFSPLNIPSGTHEITFTILQTNGQTDGGSYNDTKTATVIVPAFADVPLAVNFDAPPAGWITHNPDGQITWEIATAPREVSTNSALKLNYFEYEDKIGEIDMFISPVLDLSTVPTLTLTFDVAHARYQASNDRLRIIVMEDCQSWSDGSIVYDKAGDALKTAPAMTVPFTPSNEGQWRRELIDLSPFIGMERIQIGFVGINDWGNNIYIDNISLFTEPTRDIALQRLVTPATVTCATEVAPSILIRNTGSMRLNAVEVHYAINGGAEQTFLVSDLDLHFGGQQEVVLPAVNLTAGNNTIAVSVTAADGTSDINPANNEKAFVVVVNDSQDRIPLRETFEDTFEPAWTAVNPAGGMNWEVIDTSFGRSLYFNAFDNEAIGDEAWFVSPVLDFSRTAQASMLFDLSYALRNGIRDNLRILSSTDCGITYNELTYTFPSTEPSEGAWFPTDESDWQTDLSVNLNALAGKENVRIAFVVSNQNGNNLFLDNIEFFVTANPESVEVEELFAVYGYDLSVPELSELKITFNLPERQTVRFSVISATGQLETDGILVDVLNQTYPLNLDARMPPGIYFVRVQIADKYYTTKVLVF